MPAQKLRKSVASRVVAKAVNGNGLEHAFKEKIKGSRITPEHAKKLSLQVLQAKQCPDGLPLVAGGFKIPYFNIQGKRTEFFRFRYLEEPERKGFAALTQHKPLRYGQVRDTLNELYLPPVVDWRKVAKDKTLPIIITEGELKAACGTLHTPYPHIGLGGVWTWKSNKARQPMLQQFDDFEWEGRVVYIVYDSDAKTNPMVIQAENALAQALTARGAEPYVTRLPPLDDGTKCGVDDFLLYHSLEDYEELLENSEPWRAAKELHQLNEEVIYVQDPGFVVRVKTLQKMAPQAFISHHYATRVFWEENVDAKGKKTLIKKVAPKEWISWPMRAEVNSMTYAPGHDRITASGDLNVWPGWACEPRKGDMKLWHELLDFLFAGKPSERKWLEQWLAYPLQHPGEKMYTYVLMWGRAHGTGKSMIGYCMRQIYGKNWTEIKNEHLNSSHNEWAENKQFVLGDELTLGEDKRDVCEKLKGTITQEEMRINIKFIPSYVLRDRINYYFTSNHPDAFFLEDKDRRAFVHEVKGEPLPFEFYKKFERWMRADLHPGASGPSALFDYLLNVDLTGFEPRGHAPMTDAKREMMQNTRSDLGSWVARLREQPDEVLKIGNGAPLAYRLWKVEDLLRLYDPEGKTRTTSTTLARELRRQGFQKAGNGMSCPTKTDGQCRLWVIRDVPELYWHNQAKAADFYDNERRMPVAKRNKMR